MRGRIVASGGFTLIEIIATLVLLGILAVMSSSFFSNSVFNSAYVVDNLQSEITLQSCMEILINKAEAATSLDDFLTTAKASPPTGCTVDTDASIFVKYDAAAEAFVKDVSGKTLLKLVIKSTKTSETLTVLLSKAS